MANSSFKLSLDTRAMVIFLLCFGVLFNLISFFHLYFSSSKKIDDALQALTVSSIKLYDDTLSKVDDYLHNLSTNTSFSSSFSANGVYDNLTGACDKSDSPILPVVDSIEYDYYVSDGRHIARIGRQDFSDGSPFPRGGVISRVYDDCILLEGGYRVARQNARVGGFSSRSGDSSSFSSSSFDSLSHLKEGLKL